MWKRPATNTLIPGEMHGGRRSRTEVRMGSIPCSIRQRRNICRHGRNRIKAGEGGTRIKRYEIEGRVVAAGKCTRHAAPYPIEKMKK